MKYLAKLAFVFTVGSVLETGAMAQGWLTPAAEELNPPFCVFLFGHCSPGTTSGGLFYFSTGTYYYTPNLYFFTPGVYFFTPGTYYVFPDPLLKGDVDGVIQNLLHRRAGSRTDPVGGKLYQAHCPNGAAIQGKSLEGSSGTAGGSTVPSGPEADQFVVNFDGSWFAVWPYPGSSHPSPTDGAWSITGATEPTATNPVPTIFGAELSGPVSTQGPGNFTVRGPVVVGGVSIGITITAAINNANVVSFVASSGSSGQSCALDPESSLGFSPVPLFGATDPVSTSDGELVVPAVTDLSLGGPLPLFVRRTYTALQVENSYVGILGFNWMTNFDPYIITDSNVVAVFVEGGRVMFQKANGAYQMLFPAALPYQLVATTNGGYRFLDPRQNLIYTFNAGGSLIQIADRNGNALTVTQGPSGPTEVSDGLGRTLNFSYSQGRVATITDQTGRAIAYGRNGNLLGSVTDADGNSTAYAYNSGFGITATRRPRGNVPYTQIYNEFGQVTEQKDSEGNQSTISYASSGAPGVNTLTDPLGRTTTFAYPNLLDPASYTDAAGQTASATYDPAHRQLTYTDRVGDATAIEYDPASGDPSSFTDSQGNMIAFTWQAQTQAEFTFYNLAKITYPDGTTKSFTYDPSGNPLTISDRGGKTTTYTYNPAGQELTETNPAGGMTAFTYSTDGTLATLKDASGNVTTYSYDNLKRLAKVRFADGTTQSITRDATDKVLSVTDERGNTTSLAYDANSNLQSITDPLGKSEATSYDSDDLPSSSTDRLGDHTSYQYDPLGSVTAITDAASEKSTYTYDDLERLQSAVDPAGKTTTFGYDAEGRLTSVTDAAGNTSSVKVDKDGRPVQLTSPLGENTNVVYDSLGRVTGSTDALGRQSSLTYEPRGLLTGITSPGTITTSIAWGNLPVPASVTDPNGNVWPLTTDNAGRVTSTSDPLGQALAYKYDSRNRIQSITSPIDSVQLSRDAAGNLTGAQYSDGVTQSYKYDNDSRLLSGTGFSFTLDADGRLTGSNGLTITRDAVGRISSITYASGKTVTYSYDGRGLLAMIADWAGGSASFTFDDAQRLVSITRSNGGATQYTYDKDSRVVSIVETSSGGKSLSSINLTRDAIGRVTAANRVVPQEAAPVAGFLPLTFDAANQISGSTYDARGRLIKGDAGSTYQWSAASRLLSYTRADGSASATYDALGQRISRTAGGATRNYVINYATGIPTVATIQSGGSDLTYYVYTPGGSLLFSIDAASGSHRFYSFDETGSTTFLTGDNGAVTDSYGISPYGDVVTPGAGNATDNPFTWQGQLGMMQEPGTMLYYARFRYYDAATARFLSRDPLFSPEPTEVNPYQYAAGDPVTNGDPLGLKKISLLPIWPGSQPGQTAGPPVKISVRQPVLLFPFTTNEVGFDTLNWYSAGQTSNVPGSGTLSPSVSALLPGLTTSTSSSLSAMLTPAIPQREEDDVWSLAFKSAGISPNLEFHSMNDLLFYAARAFWR